MDQLDSADLAQAFLPTLACLLSTFQNGSRSYTGYQVFRIHPQNEFHIFDLIQSLFLKNNDLDFFSEPSRRAFTDVLVPPPLVDLMKTLLKNNGAPHEVLINDIQTKIVEQSGVVAPLESEITWTSYHRLETINKWMDKMANKYSQYVELIKIGKSFEGRPLRVMKISQVETDGKLRPSIWIDGGIHASPATVTYMANELVKKMVGGKKIVGQFDWFIHPVMNPDGFEYTHSGDRLWRKTRSEPPKQPHTGKILECCKGTDPNRNWDFQWAGKGTSNHFCSQKYHGPAAASEPEVFHVQNFLLANNQSLKLYLSFHSYSQLLLIPWSYDSIRADDHEELMAVAEKSANALKAVYNTEYQVGTAPEILYAAAGGSHDFAKAVVGVKYSYCFELRDKGNYGFFLPPDQIIPTGIETLAAVLSMAQDMAKIYNIHD